MKKIIVVSLLLLIGITGNAQTTTGGKSPIIIGAQAKVNYVSERVVNRKVPAALAPYLAGLLFSNKIKSDAASMNAALNVWFKKYADLKTAIESFPDSKVRGPANLRLAEGDFAAVETLLKIRTSYSGLISAFPNTYQTNGDKSPIIVGDFGTVTYVVKEVINYQLPEGLTINLLNELRSKDQVIGGLKGTVESRDAIIKSYISQFNVIKAQLKNSPSVVYQKAYQFFKNGDYSAALNALAGAVSSDQFYGESNLLKAKILLLQFNSSALDAMVPEINKAFSIGIQLKPSAANYFDYGKFLTDHVRNYGDAIMVLEKAELLNTDILRRIQILNYLGISYAAFDRVKADEMLEKAIKILDGLEPLKDHEQIVLKSQLLINLSAGYSARFFDPTVVKTAIHYAQQAIDQLNRLPTLNEEDQCRRAFYYNQQGQQFAMIADVKQAEFCYRQALDFFENAVARKPYLYTIGLSTVYYYQAELYYNNGESPKAIALLTRALSMIDPKIDVNQRIYYTASEQLNTALIKNLVALNRYTEVLQCLYSLKGHLQPLLRNDPKTFQIHQTWIFTDLGSIYLGMKNIDSAARYLPPAYEYYVGNPNAAQFDKQKFATCLQQMNELLVQSNRIYEAVSNNRKLLSTFKTGALINKFAYDDFIPQIERQTSRAYSAGMQKDSAYYHMQIALATVETKAKQYGTLYLSAYNDYAIQNFLLHLKFKDYVIADAEALKFIKNCNTINEVDPYVKANMQSAVGEAVANFAVNLFGFTQDPANGIAGSPICFQLFEKAEAYFKSSESYFKNALQNNPNDGFKYAMELSNAIYLQSFWSAQITDPAEKSLHVNKKCALGVEARTVVATLPVNPVTAGLSQKIQLMTAECH